MNQPPPGSVARARAVRLGFLHGTLVAGTLIGGALLGSPVDAQTAATGSVADALEAGFIPMLAYRADAPLRPSGLMGPVLLMVQPATAR